ncbi:MAG: monovalent cation/H(+) antiporter subunit G [Verrucomicrobiota bacterium]
MIVVASGLLIIGSIFALIAAIGVVRMPDLYCRMHAATKAGAFGVSLMLLGLVVVNPSIRVLIQSVMIILFFYLTAPLAGHMIGRVALQRGVPFWKAPEAEGIDRRKTESEDSSLKKDSRSLT